MKMGPIPAWLDEATAALVKETVNLRDLAACCHLARGDSLRFGCPT
jgi:hypothetical protein